MEVAGSFIQTVRWLVAGALAHHARTTRTALRALSTTDAATALILLLGPLRGRRDLPVRDSYHP